MMSRNPRRAMREAVAFTSATLTLPAASIRENRRAGEQGRYLGLSAACAARSARAARHAQGVSLTKRFAATRRSTAKA